MSALVTIDQREYDRLLSVERAWESVFNALLKGNKQAFQRPMTGTECALAEIARLQQAARQSV